MEGSVFVPFIYAARVDFLFRGVEGRGGRGIHHRAVAQRWLRLFRREGNYTCSSRVGRTRKRPTAGHSLFNTVTSGPEHTEREKEEVVEWDFYSEMTDKEIISCH